MKNELKQLRLKVEQLTIQRDHAQADAKSQDKTLLAHNHRRMAMYDSLMIEKIDLMGRIARIDQRILVLGLSPEPTAGATLKVR